MRQRGAWIVVVATIAMGTLTTATVGAIGGDASSARTFDACKYLTAADVRSVAGTGSPRRTTSGLLPAEGIEAGVCGYQAEGATPYDTTLTIWTMASVVGMGYPASEFDDDGLFQLDLGTVSPNAAGTPVRGLGDAASIFTGEGPATLFVRSHGVRFAIEGSGPLGKQPALVAEARGVLQQLTVQPPVAEKGPSANEFAPALPSAVFGGGRAVVQQPGFQNYFNGGFGPYEVRNGAVTTDIDPIGSGPPADLDLRAYALGNDGRSLVAVLEFAGALAPVATIDEAHIAEHIGVTFWSPTGAAKSVVIEPDLSGATVDGVGTSGAPSGRATVAIDGNVAALRIPASFGVGPDWTTSAWSRAESTSGRLSGRPGLQGWQSVTPPVVVGSLDGADGHAVRYPATAARPGSLDARASASLPASARVTSIALRGHGKDAELAVTFAAPPRPITDLHGRGPGTLLLDLRLVSPLLPLFPMRIGVTIPPPPAQMPTQASVIDGTSIGNVPVRIDGDVAHIAIGNLVATATTPPTQSGQPGSQRLLNLGTTSSVFDVQATLGADGCLCPHGEPNGFRLPPNSTHGPGYERLTVRLSGIAIAITRASTGTTAVGMIDPSSGEFVATNADEIWAGALGDGMRGTVSFPASKVATFAPKASLTDVTGLSILDPGSFVKDVTGTIGGMNGPGTTGPGQAARCPVVRYTIYAPGGFRFTTYEGPPPFPLVQPSDGFDILKYPTLWDAQQALAQMHLPSNCGASTSATSPAANAGAAPAPSATLMAAKARTIVPGDIAGDWSVCATAFVQGLESPGYSYSSATPCVRASQLDALPASTGGGTGAAGGSGPAGTTGASSGGGSGTIAIVIVVLGLAALGGILFAARRRTAEHAVRADDA